MPDTNSTANRDKAVALLINYFSAIATKAGMKWDPDYTAEVGEAVDRIIDAAVEKARDEFQKAIKRGGRS
jgi:hypothetical protein